MVMIINLGYEPLPLGMLSYNRCPPVCHCTPASASMACWWPGLALVHQPGRVRLAGGLSESTEHRPARVWLAGVLM